MNASSNEPSRQQRLRLRHLYLLAPIQLAQFHQPWFSQSRWPSIHSILARISRVQQPWVLAADCSPVFAALDNHACLVEFCVSRAYFWCRATLNFWKTSNSCDLWGAHDIPSPFLPDGKPCELVHHWASFPNNSSNPNSKFLFCF